MKNQAKISQRYTINLHKTTLMKESYDIPDREFKITVIKMHTEVKRT